jgi:hypothetical protein
MHLITRNSIFFLAGAVLLLSCKKTSSEKNVVGRWRITALSTTIGALTVDIWGLQQPCAKDGFYDMEASKDVFADEGPSKCNAIDQQRIKLGTWDIGADGKTLYLPYSENGAPPRPVPFNIIEFTATNITLKSISGDTVTDWKFEKVQ